MFTESAMLFFYCETPVHPGAGASVSYVDLPIQREKHTDYPIIQASGVKGAFRDWATSLYKDNKDKSMELIKVFGPKSDAANDHGGTLSFTDAQVLLFPVRSFKGGFAWITCPFVLNRFSRFLNALGAPGFEIPEPADHGAWTSVPCAVKADNGKIILEDFAFDPEDSLSNNLEQLAIWISCCAFPEDTAFNYIKKQLSSHLVVLSNTCFKNFVLLSTEIITRISIGETGTVESGLLWTQELLPSDTLLYSLSQAKDMTYKDGNRFEAKESQKFIKKTIEKSGILQICGDETIGRGLVRVRYIEKPDLPKQETTAQKENE
jgi:CRISPR-associated protein Cmr4